jgi:2-polyprenyl-3-methyl-5-hydroxy-6-metoxy-1,4-benzoquinol methylase
MGSDSNRTWQFFGTYDPYYGVVPFEEYHSEKINDLARQQFFESGRQHVERVVQLIKTHFDPSFAPERTLDFGCGVGRVLIPLAAVSKIITGVDISTGMMQAAAKNCAEQGISNAEFIQSDDTLSRLTGTYSLVHSHVVLQHIPIKRGEVIFNRLVDLVAPGGIGAIHVTYFRDTRMRYNLLYRARLYLPFFNGIVNLILKKPYSYPLMQMNEYNVSRLLHVLHTKNCHKLFCTFSAHPASHINYEGIILFFQKKGKPA